jgi:hypothetical protein
VKEKPMPKVTQARPRLTALLTVLLLLQAPLLVLLGLNLLTNHWAFLTPWPSIWAELEAAIMLIQSSGQITLDDVLFYDVIAFAVLVFSAVMALIAGATFHRGQAITWVLGLLTQIGTLVSGLGLYFVHKPSQAYWLLVMGVVMVLYLNYGDLSQWFLRPDTGAEEDSYA